MILRVVRVQYSLLTVLIYICISIEYVRYNNNIIAFYARITRGYKLYNADREPENLFSLIIIKTCER